MPQIWQPNALFLVHGRYRIYHVYSGDQFDSGIREFWYGCTVFASDDGTSDGEFDVRGLPNPQRLQDFRQVEGRKALIRQAIESGYFDDVLGFGEFAVEPGQTCCHEPKWSTLQVETLADPPQLKVECWLCDAIGRWRGFHCDSEAITWEGETHRPTG